MLALFSVPNTLRVSICDSANQRKANTHSPSMLVWIQSRDGARLITMPATTEALETDVEGFQKS